MTIVTTPKNVVAPVNTQVNQTAEMSKILERIDALKYQLQNELPEIAQSVKLIHKDLKECPELVHMMTPEQVNVLVQGVDSLNDFTFAKSQAEKKAIKTSKAVAKKESLADMLAILGDNL